MSCVVSEYDLTDLGGLNLLRAIRFSHPDLPFVLAPREGSELLASEAVAMGVSGYISQSATTETILSRIQTSLHQESTLFDEESTNRYQRLIEMAPAPINIFDENGDTIWGNDAVLELLGLDTRDELIGRSVFEFIHPDDRSLARRELEIVIEAKSSVGPTRMKLLRPDDQVRHIQIATAVGTYRGEDIGQAIIIDATEREALHRQLTVLSTWLRHNIRNKMNIVHGIAGNLRDEHGDPIEKSAVRIQSNVEQLLAQADREQEIADLLVNPPDTVPFDIVSVIEATIQESQSAYPQATIDVGQCEPTEVRAAPQFSEALGELFENAIEHNDAETPTVSVDVDQSESSSVRIHVRDDGPGIPDVERAVLRSDHSIDQLNHGSGLGLLFVYSVVAQSNGSLQFSENDPRGSVVTIALPTHTDG